MRLDLNLLVSLDVLLAEQNVTRAAARLKLSQPALSAQLRHLREAFADPLLIPGARGMTLTSKAETLRVPLRHLLDEIHQFVAGDAAFVPADAVQTFRIVASDAIHSVVTTALAARLADVAPNCLLALLSYDPHNTLERMAVGEIDLLLASTMSMPASLRARKVYDEKFLCVMRKGHPALSQPMDLDRFCAMDHVLVSPSGGGFQGTVDEALAGLGRERHVAVSLPNFLLVPSVLSKSDMIATVPARLAQGWADTLAVVAPPCEVPGYTVLMGWHPRAHADPAQQWLREILITLLSGDA